MGRLSCSTGSWRICNRGKTPGTPVQHALALGTRGAEFRHFLASDCGTTWDDTKSARGFAPLTPNCLNALIYQHEFRSPRARRELSLIIMMTEDLSGTVIV